MFRIHLHFMSLIISYVADGTPIPDELLPNVPAQFQNPTISLNNSIVTINLKLESANGIPGF